MPQFELKSGGLAKEQIRHLADIHRSEVPGGFLASLGSEALNLLYTFAGESEYATLVAGFELGGSRPVGFICGTWDCARLYRSFLSRRGWQLVPVVLPRLLTTQKLRKAAETLLYPAKGQGGPLPKAEILNFAVQPAYRGSGLAQDLLRRLILLLKGKGVSKIKIVTGANQIAAQHFYEKVGAQRAGAMAVHRGQESLIYVLDI